MPWLVKCVIEVCRIQESDLISDRRTHKHQKTGFKVAYIMKCPHTAPPPPLCSSVLAHHLCCVWPMNKKSFENHILKSCTNTFQTELLRISEAVFSHINSQDRSPRLNIQMIINIHLSWHRLTLSGMVDGTSKGFGKSETEAGFNRSVTSEGVFTSWHLSVGLCTTPLYLCCSALPHNNRALLKCMRTCYVKVRAKLGT